MIYKLIDVKQVARFAREYAGVPYSGSGPRVDIVDGDGTPPSLETKKTVRGTEVQVLVVSKAWLKQQAIKHIDDL